MKVEVEKYSFLYYNISVGYKIKRKSSDDREDDVKGDGENG